MIYYNNIIKLKMLEKSVAFSNVWVNEVKIKLFIFKWTATKSWIFNCLFTTRGMVMVLFIYIYMYILLFFGEMSLNNLRKVKLFKWAAYLNHLLVCVFLFINWSIISDVGHYHLWYLKKSHVNT